MSIIIYNKSASMKVTKEQAAENRERVVDVASRLFREKGFGGIGVADIMKGAGMTHGGFYGQFKSKDDLAAQACIRAFAQETEKLDALVGASRGDPLTSLIRNYVSEAHRDGRGTGCVIAALGPEAARQNRPLRQAFTHGIKQLIDFVAKLEAGASKAAKRKKAMATVAEMVGSIVLARAVDDPAFSREILEAAVRNLTAPRQPRGHTR
jgi:TetR/AcrR family transcriptional regulator, transcriptional repressor for nem operon